MNTDKIILRNLRFLGCHGCLPQEQSNPQPFLIDIDLHTDLKKAATSDNLNDTINYAEVFTLVQQIVTKEKYRLLERLSQSIAKAILETFPRVTTVRICVHKPEAPIEGTFDSVGVDMTFNR